MILSYFSVRFVSAFLTGEDSILLRVIYLYFTTFIHYPGEN
jgi:hypothetical protein